MKLKQPLILLLVVTLLIVGPGSVLAQEEGASLELDKTTFAPGEQIEVYFTAPSSFPSNAWVGIIPSDVSHGSEAENDKYDVAYRYLDGLTSGVLTFKAPDEPGSYDFRMHDTDSDGKEVASVTFTVAVGGAEAEVVGAEGAAWTSYTNGNYVNDLLVFEGYLVAATSGGIVGWNIEDGTYEKITSEQVGLASNTVTSIASDEKERAWIGTYNSGLSVCEGDVCQTFNQDNSGLPNNTVKEILFDADGSVWLATSGGLSHVDAELQTFTTYKWADDQLPSSFVNDVAFDSKGGLWAGSNGGVSYFDGATWTSYTRENTDSDGEEPWEGLPSSGVYAVAVDAQDTVWCGTSSGLSHFDGQTWETLISEDTGLLSDWIQDLAFDPDGNLWIATSWGVSVFDGSAGWTNYKEEDGLVDDDVTTIFIDEKGGVWLGTETKGVSYFDGAAWKSFVTDDPLLSNNVVAVAVDQNDAVWLGTSTDGVNYFDGEKWLSYTGDNSGLPSDWISDILINEQGNPWFATGWGVSYFDGQTWITFKEDDGLVGNSVRVLAFQGDEGLWVGTSGGVSFFDGETWTNYTQESTDADGAEPWDGLPKDYIQAIAVDGKGTVWIGTGGGLTQFDGKTWTTYTSEDTGLASDNVQDIFIHPDGTLWIGTSWGLSYFDGQTWTNYKEKDGLVDDDVEAIVMDGEGNLWFATYGGVSKFDGEVWTSYTTADGLTAPRVNDLAFESTGTMWIGTYDSGASRFVPGVAAPPKEEPVEVGEAPKPQPAGEGLVSYTAASGLYSVTYPDDWEIDTAGAADEEQGFELSSPDYMAFVGLTISNKGEDFDTFVDNLLQELPEEMQQISRSTGPDGKVRLEAEIPMGDDETMHIIGIFWQAGPYNNVLALGTPSGAWDDYVDALNAVADSVVVDPEAKFAP